MEFSTFTPQVRLQIADLAPKEGWRFSITHYFPFMIGVLWADTGDPESGKTVSSCDYYDAAHSLLVLIPMGVHISVFEVDDPIQSVMVNPSKSPWRDCFTIREMEAVFRHYPMAPIGSLS